MPRRLPPFLLCTALLVPSLAGAAPQVRYAHSVVLGECPAPNRAMVGDFDADGRADLMIYSPGNSGTLGLWRMTPLGKLCDAGSWAAGVGGDARAVVRLARAGAPAQVAVVVPDGRVRLVTGTPGGGTTDLANLPTALRAPGPLVAAALDLDQDGNDELALVRQGARDLWVLKGADWMPVRLPTPVATAFGHGKGRLAWTDRRGGACEVGIAMESRRWRMAGSPALLQVADHPADGQWSLLDVDGDGRDDMVCLRSSSARFGARAVEVRYGYSNDEVAEAPFGDADGDGLLNGWETGKIHPGDLDLPALGCTPRHRDILCEVQRMADMPEATVRAEMGRVVRFYAQLGSPNLDGAGGWSLHPIIREPISEADRALPWWDLGARYHPETHRGITHWMVVYNGGGGQSGEMADRGGCGGHALYATFIHEFGHQLGLNHTGFWNAAWCPVYPSLMNYAYSYQLRGDGNAITYSTGKLAKLVLRERDLDETLPVTADEIPGVTGPPYRFRTKPADNGRSVMVDWNWNGIFGEKHVAADINYGYSTTAGERHTIGKSYTAPALATSGRGRGALLLLFSGLLPAGLPTPPADGSATHPSLDETQPGRLVARQWLGKDPGKEGARWSPETEIAGSGVVGDPSATTLAGRTWLAYPTTSGVVVRPVAGTNGGQVTAGPASLLPGTVGDQVTLATLGDGLVAARWRDATTPVRLVRLAVRDGRAVPVGEPMDLGFTSTVPVGLASGAGRTLWVGLMQDQPHAPGRFQLRSFTFDGRGGHTQTGLEWIGGPAGGERGSSRVMLLWEPNRAFGARGQVTYIACGSFSPQSPWQCHYACTRIADTTVNGGWLTRRYYDEWTTSRSAPGACLFRGDIAFASRWFGNVHGTENDNLFAAFHGRGIESEPMGDFDDVSFIADWGMATSIRHVTR